MLVAAVVVLVLWLLLAVVRDANPEVVGACEDVAGSVCVLSGCPGGFDAVLSLSCAVEGYLCCVPSS